MIAGLADGRSGAPRTEPAAAAGRPLGLVTAIADSESNVRGRKARRLAASGRAQQRTRVTARSTVVAVGAEHPHQLGD